MLKLALLKQLPSKVNCNVPTEEHGVFVFSEAPEYDSRGFAVLRCTYLCQQNLHVLLHQSACSCMFVGMCMHPALRIIGEEWADGRRFLTKDSTWNQPLATGPQSPRWPLTSGVTRRLGYSLSNTAPRCSLLPGIGWGGWLPPTFIVPVCNPNYLNTGFLVILVTLLALTLEI